MSRQVMSKRILGLSYFFILILVLSSLVPVPFALWTDSGVALAAFGDIEEEVDSYEWAASDAWGIGGIVHVSGNVYAWTWDEYSSNSGYVSTISITEEGELGATIETVEVSSYCSSVLNVVNLPGTEVFVISYYVPYVPVMGRIATVTIDSSGDISAVIDTGEISESFGHIIHVDGNFFVLSAATGLVSFRVEDDGQVLSYFGSWTGNTIKTGDMQYASVDYTSGGNVGIAFYDSNGDDLWYGYHNGVSWSFSQVITSGDVGKYCCLRFDSSDHPGISYLDSSNRDLEYAYHNGASWSTTVVDSADYCGYYSSMAFDSGDNPGISYYDATNHHVQYAYNSGSWSTGIVEDMGSDNGTWSVVGFDADDDPHIVYRDETNDDVRYAYYDSGWTATGLVTVDNVGSYLGMAMDSGGNAHVVYSAYPDDVYRYITGSESSWSSPEDLLGDLNGRVRVRMLGSSPVVAYRTESGSTDVLRVACKSGGLWVYSSDLDTPAIANYNFGLATKSGTVGVAYVDSATDLAYASLDVVGVSSIVDGKEFDAAASAVFGPISEVGSTDCFTFMYQDSSNAFVQTFLVSASTGAITVGDSVDVGDAWNRTSVEYLWSTTIMVAVGVDYGYTMDLFTYSVNTSTGAITEEDSCTVTEGVDRNTYGMDIVMVGDGDDGVLLFWRDQSSEGNLYPVVVDGTEIEALPDGKWEYTSSCSDTEVVMVERDSGVLGVFYSEASGEGRSGVALTIDVDPQAVPPVPTEFHTEGIVGNVPYITDTTPEFSAVYNGGDTATYVQVQVDDDDDFSSTYWDSGQTLLGYSLTDGNRCQDVTYAGPDLAWHVPYYWRIRFWDEDGIGNWGHPMFILNHAPSSPEHLQCEGLTNPWAVEDPTPEFEAMYLDDDGAINVAEYYQLQVGTDNDWATAEMWDSTQTALTTPTAEHDWCEDIVYAGSALDGAVAYYWRVKFWDDDGAEGEWSTDVATFTMTGTPVVTTSAATGVSGSGATLNGSLVYDTGENCEYGFLYGFSPTTVTIATPWSGSGDTKNTGDSFSSTLTGIDYGTTVYFQAMCRNAGSTGYGSVLTFTTLVGAASVSTQYATDVSTSTSALEGYLVEDGGEDCEVSFQWGTTGECWGWTESNSTYESYDDLGVGVTLGQTFTVDPGGAVDIHGVALKVYREGTPGSVTVEIWTTTGSVPDTSGGSLKATGTYDGNSLTSDASGEWIVVSFGSPGVLAAGTLYSIVVEVVDGDSSNSVFWLADDSGGVYGSGDFCSKTGAGAWGTVASTTGMFAVFDDYTGTSWLSGYREGSNFTDTLTGLDVATVYRFRARANNTSGTVYGSDEVFLTAIAAAKPTGLRASPLGPTEVSLTWTRGYGAYHTMVRYKANGYPTTYTDGEVAYLGDSSSQLVTGLLPGTTYYFAAWSVVPGAAGNEFLDTEPINIGSPYAMDAGSDSTTIVEADLGWVVDDYYVDDQVVNVTRSKYAYVSDYDGGTTTMTLGSSILAQVPTDEFYVVFVSHAMGTTKAGVEPGSAPYDFDDVGSSNWFLEPSNTALAFLPGRGVIEDSAEQFGMGVGNMFFLLTMLLSCAVGFFVFLLTRSLLGMVIGLAIFFLLAMVLGVIPGWIFVMWLVVGFGGGFALNKGLQV